MPAWKKESLSWGNRSTADNQVHDFIWIPRQRKQTRKPAVTFVNLRQDGNKDSECQQNKENFSVFGAAGTSVKKPEAK